MDYDNVLEEIYGVWPRDKIPALSQVERSFVESVIKTPEDLTKLKDAIEAMVEDKPKKLPNLLAFIKKIFGATPKPVVKTDGEVADDGPSTTLYQNSKKENLEAKKVFDSIFDQWPPNQYVAESRKRTLATFLDLARTEPLEDIQTACGAYLDAFSDAPEGIVPLFMRTLLGDREIYEEWLRRGRGKVEFGDFDRQQFEAAYAWYPQFVNKASEKAKKNSWNAWIKNIKKEDRLDFMLACKTYAEERKRQGAEQGATDKEIETYTKNFVNFINEGVDAVDPICLSEVKRDFVGYRILDLALENGVDLSNIYGDELENFYVCRALPYHLKKYQTIREAVFAGLDNCYSLLKVAAGSVKNLKLAQEQIAAMDVDRVVNNIMQKLIQEKSVEMPRKLGN